MRWLPVIALLFGACAFDPGGTILGTDEGADASSGVNDAGPSNLIDATPTLPIDANLPTTIDAAPMDQSCDENADCPGQVCCVGWTSACADECGFGTEQVCEDISDCSDNDRCCDHVWGPNTCGFCF